MELEQLFEEILNEANRVDPYDKFKILINDLKEKIKAEFGRCGDSDDEIMEIFCGGDGVGRDAYSGQK